MSEYETASINGATFLSVWCEITSIKVVANQAGGLTVTCIDDTYRDKQEVRVCLSPECSEMLLTFLKDNLQPPRNASGQEEVSP